MDSTSCWGSNKCTFSPCAFSLTRSWGQAHYGTRVLAPIPSEDPFPSHSWTAIYTPPQYRYSSIIVAFTKHPSVNPLKCVCPRSAQGVKEALTCPEPKPSSELFSSKWDESCPSSCHVAAIMWSRLVVHQRLAQVGVITRKWSFK